MPGDTAGGAPGAGAGAAGTAGKPGNGKQSESIFDLFDLNQIELVYLANVTRSHTAHSLLVIDLNLEKVNVFICSKRFIKFCKISIL